MQSIRKTIVIPDVHHRIKGVQNILDSEKDYDEVVFLGDFFDSFLEPPIVAGFADTCAYLKHLVLEHPSKDKFKFLVGNHDMLYIYCNNGKSDKRVAQIRAYHCSGFTNNKAKKFRKCFYDQGLKDDFFIDNFRIAYKTQGFTLSHAGFHERHIPAMRDFDYVLNEIVPDVWKNFRNLNHQYNWILSGAGYCRGGFLSVGGALWLDWNQEFIASEHIGKQIVGHTRSLDGPKCIYPNTEKESWNIDTEQHYGIIQDGKFKTKYIP